MTRLEYTFKTDTLFKMLFVKHTDLLKELVSELLGIRLGSIGEFHVTNPEMPPESLGDKFCRLDINMTVNGQRVDLEIQGRRGLPRAGAFQLGQGIFDGAACGRRLPGFTPDGDNQHNKFRPVWMRGVLFGVSSA